MQQEQNAYILGTDLEEMNRLGLQHQVWASEAQKGWQLAGFTRGMHLLDLGSGPGFCTREMAKIVGRDGRIIAVDKSKIYLDYLNEINKTQQLNIETKHTDFDNLDLSDATLDGMYCRWALAWIPNPDEIMTKVHSAMKVGGKVVIHEYYHWMTHQINPSGPNVKKAIAGCYKSFQDAAGNIDVGKELPSILEKIGFKVTGIRPMCKMARPGELTWQWPRSFYEIYWPKIQEMGYISEEELKLAFENLKEIEKNNDSTLFCPSLVEIIAEKV